MFCQKNKKIMKLQITAWSNNSGNTVTDDLLRPCVIERDGVRVETWTSDD